MFNYYISQLTFVSFFVIFRCFACREYSLENYVSHNYIGAVAAATEGFLFPAIDYEDHLDPVFRNG